MLNHPIPSSIHHYPPSGHPLSALHFDADIGGENLNPDVPEFVPVTSRQETDATKGGSFEIDLKDDKEITKAVVTSEGSKGWKQYILLNSVTTLRNFGVK